MVTAAETGLACGIGSITNGRIGTAAAKKSASSIHNACSHGFCGVSGVGLQRQQQAAKRLAIVLHSAHERGGLLLGQADGGQPRR